MTAASVAVLPVTGSQYRVRDHGTNALRGFAVQVSAGGRRTFTLDFRVKGDRRTVRMTFGHFPAVSVHLARREAQTAKSVALMGRNPAADRILATETLRQARSATRLAAQKRREESKAASLHTVERIARDYLRDKRSGLKDGTIALYESTIACYLSGSFGAMPLPTLTSDEVSALLKLVAEHKIPAGVARRPLVGRKAGGPGAARTLRRFLTSLWKYAADERKIVNVACPVPTAKRAKLVDKAKERFLTPEECTRLLRAISLAETEGLFPAPKRRRKYVDGPTAKHRPKVGVDTPTKADPIAIAALRFGIYTGWRRDEVLTLQWRMLRPDLGQIALPNTKTGESFRAVSSEAMAILDSLPRNINSPWCFPSPRSASRPLGPITRLWYAVRHAAEIDGTRLHDLRHTAASLAINNDATLVEVQAMLGHKSARATERYAKLLPATGLRAAERLSNALAKASPEPSGRIEKEAAV